MALPFHQEEGTTVSMMEVMIVVTTEVMIVGLIVVTMAVMIVSMIVSMIEGLIMGLIVVTIQYIIHLNLNTLIQNTGRLIDRSASRSISGHADQVTTLDPNPIVCSIMRKGNLQLRRGWTKGVSVGADVGGGKGVRKGGSKGVRVGAGVGARKGARVGAYYKHIDAETGIQTDKVDSETGRPIRRISESGANSDLNLPEMVSSNPAIPDSPTYKF
jgi:hypothetical protein